MLGRGEQVRVEHQREDGILVPLLPQELGECLPGSLRWVSSLMSLSISHSPFLSDFLKSCGIHTDRPLPGGAQSRGLSAPWTGHTVPLTCAPALGADPWASLGVRDTPQLQLTRPTPLAVPPPFHGALTGLPATPLGSQASECQPGARVTAVNGAVDPGAKSSRAPPWHSLHTRRQQAPGDRPAGSDGENQPGAHR